MVSMSPLNKWPNCLALCLCVLPPSERLDRGSPSAVARRFYNSLTLGAPVSTDRGSSDDSSCVIFRAWRQHSDVSGSPDFPYHSHSQLDGQIAFAIHLERALSSMARRATREDKKQWVAARVVEVAEAADGEDLRPMWKLIAVIAAHPELCNCLMTASLRRLRNWRRSGQLASVKSLLVACQTSLWWWLGALTWALNGESCKRTSGLSQE